MLSSFVGNEKHNRKELVKIVPGYMCICVYVRNVLLTSAFNITVLVISVEMNDALEQIEAECLYRAKKLLYISPAEHILYREWDTGAQLHQGWCNN